jgi:hypothetical protein
MSKSPASSCLKCKSEEWSIVRSVICYCCSFFKSFTFSSGVAAVGGSCAFRDWFCWKYWWSFFAHYAFCWFSTEVTRAGFRLCSWVLEWAVVVEIGERDRDLGIKLLLLRVMLVPRAYSPKTSSFNSSLH